MGGSMSKNNNCQSYKDEIQDLKRTIDFQNKALNSKVSYDPNDESEELQARVGGSHKKTKRRNKKGKKSKRHYYK